MKKVMALLLLGVFLSTVGGCDMSLVNLFGSREQKIKHRGYDSWNGIIHTRNDDDTKKHDTKKKKSRSSKGKYRRTADEKALDKLKESIKYK
jgi:hypothetical protein